MLQGGHYMDDCQRELMTKNGFDVDGALKRFINNEPLYIKCLKKFPYDKSYEGIKRAYHENNCEECFKYAHTLKGLASNLGINEIYNLLIPMVAKLKRGDMDIEDDIKKLDSLCQETYDIINKLN
jgi:chemotaxis protein histidine kinase CheA